MYIRMYITKCVVCKCYELQEKIENMRDSVIENRVSTMVLN